MRSGRRGPTEGRAGRGSVGGTRRRAAMKRKGLIVWVMMVAAAIGYATAAEADRRVALVIGNSTYRNASQLPNTINDANAIAVLFRSVGFEVVNLRTDLGVLDFKR